jgi:hypothetical protein
MLALQLAMNVAPVRRRVTPMALLLPAVGVKPLLQNRVADIGRERRAVDGARLSRRAISRVESPALFNLRQLHTRRIDILSTGRGPSLEKPKERTLKMPEEALPPRANKSRNRGRFPSGSPRMPPFHDCAPVYFRSVLRISSNCPVSSTSPTSDASAGMALCA